MNTNLIPSSTNTPSSGNDTDEGWIPTIYSELWGSRATKAPAASPKKKKERKENHTPQLTVSH